MGGELEIKRRRLPHWRLEDATYFVTWGLAPGIQSLDESERDVIVGALLFFHGQRYHLPAFVVMDDHIHVMLTPIGCHSLSQIIHSWKSFTANKINKLRHLNGRLWQVEYHDRIVRTEEDLFEKLEYILTNPVRRWPELRDYQWVDWLRD